MSHRRPTCLIADLSDTLIGDPSDMLHHACLSPIGLRSGISDFTSDQAFRTPIRHVVLQWVSNQTLWSPKGFR